MRRSPALILVCALASACSGGGGETDGADAGSEDTGSASTPTSGPEDPTAGEMTRLVLPMAWQQVPAADDPLADHRPAEVACALGSWVYEAQGLEVNTASCNYGMFSQPSQVAIVKGARLQASIYHFDLSAEAPATAHVALLIGEEVVWEQDIAIPGKANAYAIDLPLDFAAPEGTPVYFHVHNHGQNTWTMGSIEVEVF